MYTIISKILSDNKKCPPENREGKKVLFYQDPVFLANFYRSKPSKISFCLMDFVFSMHCCSEKTERKSENFYGLYYV